MKDVHCAVATLESLIEKKIKAHRNATWERNAVYLMKASHDIFDDTPTWPGSYCSVREMKEFFAKHGLNNWGYEEGLA